MQIETVPKIEMMPISSLKPYAQNARTHSKRQLQQIADSITRFGFTNPVLISDNNEIVAGHGRVLAAIELGLTVRGANVAPATVAAGRAASTVLTSANGYNYISRKGGYTNVGLSNPSQTPSQAYNQAAAKALASQSDPHMNGNGGGGGGGTN